MKTQLKSENDFACPISKSVSAKILPFIEILAAQVARAEIERLKDSAASER